ncbi:cytochrome P450, partial [Macrophomina phaseolina]
PGLFSAKDGPAHQRQRRIFAPAFTNTALRKQETMLAGHVKKLVAHLHRACESGEAQVNFADLFNFLTFDVMADLAFGAPLGLLDSGSYNTWVRNMFAVIKLLSLRLTLLSYTPLIVRLLTPLLASKSAVEKRNQHFSFAAELVNKRLDRSEGLDRPDIWSFVEKKQDTLTRPEMHSNAIILMGAGSETAASALCGIVWYLTRQLNCMEALVREIRELRGEKDFTMENLVNLPYLNAVINEGMRLYPPAPDMQHRVVPAGGATICGNHVPAETTVAVYQYPAYHSRHNFHRPEEFLPERWLPEALEKGEFVKDDRRVLQPFSKGPRSCIGKNLALHEIRLTLAYLLWHFDLYATSASENWLQQKSYLAWDRPALQVVVKGTDTASIF